MPEQNRNSSGGGRPAHRDDRNRRGDDRRDRDDKPSRYEDRKEESFPRGGGFRGGGPGAGIAAPRNDSHNDDTPLEMPKKKSTGRCRLFIGNIPLDIKEEELKEMFAAHGDVEEFFLSGKGFAFIRMDTRSHAELAKEALDGAPLRGRPLRVRFAVHGASIKVKELSPFVSNEVLYQAFSIFGDVERAVHIVDEKGRPIGEGIVEFERKAAAQEAIRRIAEGVFLLTSNPRPITAEPLEPRDEDDGLSERMIHRTAQLSKEREQQPRFAAPRSFEHEFGHRWKELYQMERARRNQLDRELKEAREQLSSDMDLAYQDYQTQLLREDLRRRQEELERLETARRERVEALRRRDEDRMERMRQQDMPPFPPPFTAGAPLYQGSFGGGDQGAGGPFPQSFGAGPVAGMEGGRNQGGGDENLVHGVQKLLQMFKGGPGENAGLGPGAAFGGFDGGSGVEESVGPPPGQLPGLLQQPMKPPMGFGGPPPGNDFQSKRRRFN